MDIDLIVTRLKERLTGLKSIGASADLEASVDGVVALPAAFVLPISEDARTTAMLGMTESRVTEVFGVVHVLSNRRDAQGSAAMSDLFELRLALRTALVGWVPDLATGESVHYTSGRLINLDGKGRLWWIDQFQLTTYFRIS